MPGEMHIRLKRAADGSSALTCVRADGSMTWQVQRGSLGLVFPTHDLTHYAVETSVALQRTRDLRAEVFARWDAVPPGGTLELTFPA